jgi:hypothetical protein
VNGVQNRPERGKSRIRLHFQMDSSEDSSEDEMITAARKRRKLTASVAAIATGALMAFSTIPLEPPRIGNCRYSRPEALQYVRSWDDDMF